MDPSSILGAKSRQLQMNSKGLAGASDYGKKISSYSSMAEVKKDMDSTESSRSTG